MLGNDESETLFEAIGTREGLAISELDRPATVKVIPAAGVPSDQPGRAGGTAKPLPPDAVFRGRSTISFAPTFSGLFEGG
jgi:hypothetical protein